MLQAETLAIYCFTVFFGYQQQFYNPLIHYVYYNVRTKLKEMKEKFRKTPRYTLLLQGLGGLPTPSSHNIQNAELGPMAVA